MGIDIEDFVNEQLKTGVFSSYEELVATALQTLRERVKEDINITDELQPAYERAVNGNAGITVTLEDVKRLSEKYQAASKNGP